MDGPEQLLDAAIEAVAEGHQRRPDVQLTASFPMIGVLATGELMVVGRSATGWGEPWQPGLALAAEHRAAIVERAKRTPCATDKCPMSWVARDWGAKGFVCPNCDTIFDEMISPCSQCGKDAVQKRYNTAKSPFYRVILAAAQALGILDAADPQWPSRLMWSNLYKIAPAAGWHPSKTLVSLQQQYCVRMLVAEIIAWKPRRILFLTGLDWADPFLAELGVINARHLTGLLAYAGRIVRPLDDVSASFVVGANPQRKDEQPMVDAIRQAFAALEQEGEEWLWMLHC